MANTFKCAACGGVFEKACSDEEAAAEYLKDFGQMVQPTDGLVCSDCYQRLLQKFAKEIAAGEHLNPVN